jgi:hypothetical protein
VTRRTSLGCALLAMVVAACHQTVWLDDQPADGSSSGTGGKTGSGGSGGSKPTDASSDGPCGQGQSIIATGDIPQVIVALDRSSEMLGTQFGLGQNDSQFNVAVSDLSAQVGNYTHPGRRAISFAYLEFPESTGDCNYLGCCSSDALPTSSYQAFTDATMACSRAGTCGYSTNHPIGAALSRAQDYFQFGTFQSQERYVLLVTDDAPDGNCTSENDCQFAQGKVDDLANRQNVTTVIIHVGTAGSTSCLQNLDAIQGAPPSWYAGNDLYYAAPTPDDLQKAIATAVSAIAAGTCRFTLSTTPAPGSQLTVSQGTTPFLQDSKNGWTYDAASARLILHGNACTGYLNSSQFGLQVYQGCPPDRPTSP